MALEARTMTYLAEQGYPVPAVEEISEDGRELVMERVDGPDMVAAMGRRPWTVRRQGNLLANLHQQLHGIAAPPWLPPAPIGAGDALLHLDLHPLNVLLGPRGPVVIDWPNAARGDPAVEVGLTWVLLASGEVPTSAVRGAIVGRARSRLVTGFTERFDLAAARCHLKEVVAWKAQDPNMSAIERAAMWRLAEAEGTGD